MSKNNINIFTKKQLTENFIINEAAEITFIGYFETYLKNLIGEKYL